MMLAKLFEPLIAGLCTKEHEAGLRVSPRSDEKKGIFLIFLSSLAPKPPRK